MECGNVRRRGVDVFAIDLVGEQVEVVFLNQVTDLVHLLARIEIARRVVRVANHDAFGLRTNEFLELLDARKGKTLLDGTRDGADDGTRTDGERHVVGVGRFGNYDFVTGVEASHEREENRFAASRGDDDVIRRHVDVVFRIVADQLLAERAKTHARTVFKHLAVDAANGVDGALWCRKVGLSDVEVIDMESACFGTITERN